MKEIHYLLGSSCNLNCDFCFWSRRIPRVSWNTKKLIVDEIVSTGIKNVTVSGGEPTCDEDFIKVLRYMFNKGLSIFLHTNGLKINKILLFKLSPLIKRVSLSLDGSNTDMCTKMRKTKEFFSHTMGLIDKLNELDVPVNIKTLVTKVNARDISNIGAILKTKDILYWSLFEFNPIDKGKLNKNKFSLSDKKFDEIVQNVNKNIKGLDIKVRLLKRQPEPYIFIAADAKVYKFDPKIGDVFVDDIHSTPLLNIISKSEKNFSL